MVELGGRIRLRGFCDRHRPDWDLRLEDPELFPSGKKWTRADHKVYVGYDDERGLYRALCDLPKKFAVTP